MKMNRNPQELANNFMLHYNNINSQSLTLIKNSNEDVYSLAYFADTIRSFSFLHDKCYSTRPGRGCHHFGLFLKENANITEDDVVSCTIEQSVLELVSIIFIISSFFVVEEGDKDINYLLKDKVNCLRNIIFYSQELINASSNTPSAVIS